MKKFLLITNADMSLQSGNVVLVNRRAEEIYKQYKIRTTCFVLNRNKDIPHSNEAIKYHNISNSNEILGYIIENNPIKIIFYGLGSYKYISYVKEIIKNNNLEIEIVLDIQGALEEGIEYDKGMKFIKNYVKYIVKRKVLERAINNVDGVFVVSDEMKEYCKSFLKGKYNLKIYKIRCGINHILTNEQKLQSRQVIRSRWGIDENTTVMVFSGYRKPWQNIDKIIETFKFYDNKMGKVFFAFFCDIDEDFKRQIKREFPKGNYVLKFLSFEEYFDYLSACDIGFLIRDYNITNKVAFPNKFSEYLNAGLMVAINKALPEPHRILMSSKIDYIDIDDYASVDSINKMKSRQESIMEFYKRTEEICRNELMYSSQVIKNKINI